MSNDIDVIYYFMFFGFKFYELKYTNGFQLVYNMLC